MAILSLTPTTSPLHHRERSLGAVANTELGEDLAQAAGDDFFRKVELLDDGAIIRECNMPRTIYAQASMIVYEDTTNE